MPKRISIHVGETFEQLSDARFDPLNKAFLRSPVTYSGFMLHSVHMEYKEAYFNGKDGSLRFFRTWSPDTSPEGLVVISHGYAEHSGRYEPTAKRLLDEGFAVWAHDHYGHGKSSGPRALIERIELLSDDLMIALETASALHDLAPVFLYGHSMGGAITALTLLRSTFPVTGVVFSAAAIRIMQTSSPLVRAFTRGLRSFAPAMPIIPFHSDGISHNSQVIEEYRNDRLNYHGKVKVATGLEMIEAEKMLDAAALSKIRVPALIIHGGEDPLIPPESSQELYDLLGSDDKTLRFFDNAYHEVHNEESADELYDMLVDWLKSHITSSS